MRVTSHHIVVLMLRMCGYIPTFSHTSSCPGFQLDLEKTKQLIFKPNTISETYYCVIDVFVLLGCYMAYDGSWSRRFGRAQWSDLRGSSILLGLLDS